MRQKRSNPRAGVPRVRKISSASDLPLTTIAENVPDEFWLHVDDDGAEYRRDYKPLYERTLRVVAEDGVETTWTCNIQIWDGAFGEIIFVCPRGRGWVLVDSTSDNFSVWRRKAVLP